MAAPRCATCCRCPPACASSRTIPDGTTWRGSPPTPSCRPARAAWRRSRRSTSGPCLPAPSSRTPRWKHRSWDSSCETRSGGRWPSTSQRRSGDRWESKPTRRGSSIAPARSRPTVASTLCCATTRAWDCCSLTSATGEAGRSSRPPGSRTPRVCIRSRAISSRALRYRTSAMAISSGSCRASGGDSPPPACGVRRAQGAPPPPPGPERLVLDEGLEVAPAQRMAQLAERLGLDLPDALTGDREALADLFERVLALFADAEPEAEDLLLLRRQRRQRALDLCSEVLTQQRVVRRARRLVLEEVAELAVLADRRLQRQRLARRLENQSHLLCPHARALRQP